MFAAGDQAECYLLGMVKNVVDLAFAGDPHPYETAKAQLIAKRRRVLFPAPEPLAFRIPVTAVERDGPIVIPRRLDAVDGRSGLQVVTSILLYLEFRSGKKWRPQCERFTNPMADYEDAWRLVNETFLHSDHVPVEMVEGVADVRRRYEKLSDVVAAD